MLYNVDKFENKLYTFTDSRINSIGQLLWNFDHNKVYKEKFDNNKVCEYYEFSSQSSNITMILFKQDLDTYIEQDKYSFLMLLFILNQSPIVSQIGDDIVRISDKKIKQLFNVNLNKLSKSDFILSIKKLMNLKITFNYKNSKGEKMRVISNLIQDLIYNEDNDEKYCTLVVSKWMSAMFEDIQYLGSKFHKGTINYDYFIKGKNKKTECMNLPQKFVELYRINKNKSEKIYSNEKYFSEILNTDKV